MMDPDQMARRYKQAMEQLNQLLYWRGEYLQELEALCSRARKTHSSSGYVVDFDVRHAAQLLDRIALQNVQITRAIESVNRYACLNGQHGLEWQSQPKGRGYGVPSEG